MSRTQILAIGVDQVTMAEAVERCMEWVHSDSTHLVVTPNAEIGYAAARNPELAAVINGADLVIPDGIGVVLAARILGNPVPGKVAGVELTNNLLEALSRRGEGRVYLLGTRPEVVAKAAEHVARQYPGVQVVGYHDGFFKDEEDAPVVAAIREARPDFLVVGMGSPRQEQWLYRHRAELNAKVCIGVGGGIDIWGGAGRRAPEWALKTNLEWLWRMVHFGRYSRVLPPLAKFVLLVMAQRLKGKSK
ncbi:MAG: WecB/TagA/CpsF family glycosyltransferase [Mycobacterium leprae]